MGLVQVNLPTVSENGCFISFSNLGMDGREGYEEGVRWELGLFQWKVMCWGQDLKWQVCWENAI